MDIQAIKQLIKVVEKSDIGEIEIVEEGRKIRISKTSKSAPAMGSNGAANTVLVQPPMPAMPAAPAPAAAPEPAAAPAPAAADNSKYEEFRAPMVGTFYRAPSPEASAYVDEGDSITPGSTLCIIEAMKLMNEIESDVSGKIARIMVENGQPVEYNQVLVEIEE